MFDIKNLQKSFVCKCGQEHVVPFSVKYGDVNEDFPAILKSVYKAGAVFLCLDEYVMFSDIETALKKCGNDYSFTKYIVKQNQSDIVDCKPKEEIRFAVCIGGENALSFVKKTGLDYIFIPTRLGGSYLDAYEYAVKSDGIKAVFSKTPKVFFVDEKLLKKYRSRDNLSYGYALLVGAKILLAETLFLFGKGEDVCPFLFDELKETCAKDISVTFFEDGFVTELAEKLFKISLLKNISGTFLCDTTMLFSFVCKRLNPGTEKAAHIGAIIYLYYTFIKTLNSPDPFYIVPECRDTVLYQLSEAVGADYKKLVLNCLPTDGKEVEFARFALNNVAANMEDALGTKQELSADILYLKKIMKDGGFSLKKLYVNDFDDALLFSAEAADKKTFLKYCYLQGFIKETLVSTQ